MTAARAIRNLLDRSGLSKSALCESAGISRSSLDEYLKGTRQPSVAQLARIGEAAGARLELAWREPESEHRDPPWLIPGNPDMKPPPLTIDQRARVLQRVVAVAMVQRRRARGDLEFPPFRNLTRR